MHAYIPLSVPNVGEQEIISVAKTLQDGWVSTAGPAVTKFEERICTYSKVAGAVACQSGTAGLHLSMLALGIGPGDEVFVPTLTFAAAVNPVRYVGAQPIFIDCDDSLCMDIAKLRYFIETECSYDGTHLVNKKTCCTIRAVVIVHVFGNLADMEALLELAAQYRLRIIEDATEALGSHFTSGPLAGKFAGTMGDIGVYSFNGNKIMTTGSGGMVVSDDLVLLAHVRYLSTQAKDDAVYFIHNEIGYNYRMTAVQAAMGLAQLEKLEGFIEAKTQNYHRYIQEGVPLHRFRPDIRPNYWFYSFLTERRDELMMILDAQQIQTRPIWHLIHLLKPYRGAQTGDISCALHYWERIVNIPCSTGLTETELCRVAQALRAF